MQCKNHPETAAAGRCAGCAESFCDNCLVEIQGQQYCGACKVMALQGRPLVSEKATRPCKEANDALVMALIGIFCFGIILGPLAIAKASKAKKMIAADPQLTGSGKAQAAMIIGIVVIVLWVLGIIVRITAFSQM